MDFTTKWLTALGTIIVSAITGTAQESIDETPLSGSLDFLAVKDFSIKTDLAFQGDDLVEWTGEGYHAGILKCRFTLYNYKEILRNAQIPEVVESIFTIKNADGVVVGSSNTDLSSSLRLMKFSKKYNTICSGMFRIIRGGEYTLSAQITPGLYSTDHLIVVKDDERVKIDKTRAKVRNFLAPELTFTSGYPYDPAAFTGEKSLSWEVISARNPANVIDRGSETFTMTSNSLKMAAEAMVALPVEGLDPGKYIFSVSSDYTPACRTFEAHVDDILKADVTLDQSQYTFGKDSEAKVSIDMQYGYPYVSPGDNDAPTIRVTTKFLDMERSKDFSDKDWENAPLNYVAEVAVPFDEITRDFLEDNNGEVPLTIIVSFNKEKQYETTVPVTFSGFADIGNITPEAPVKQIKLFNILGIEVDNSFHGIVITSDGRKLIK